jgi:hypothetical protein
MMLADRIGLPRHCRPSNLGVILMSLNLGHIQPLVALLAGILILLVPRLLNYIVAIYLIVIGIVGLGIFK